MKWGQVTGTLLIVAIALALSEWLEDCVVSREGVAAVFADRRRSMRKSGAHSPAVGGSGITAPVTAIAPGEKSN